MELPTYIAYRMFCDIHAIPSHYNLPFEKVFRELTDFASAYTEQYDAKLFHQIPGNKTSIDELLNDTEEIFGGITKELGTTDTVLAVKTLFIASYYLMTKYKNNTKLCGHISFWFDVVTHKSNGWRELTAKQQLIA